MRLGQHGILSTPAASCVIRKHGAFGGLILSASHNPGGAGGDFGIKFNGANGGPAVEKITDAIHARTRTITQYHLCDTADVELGRMATHHVDGMEVEVIDSVADYLELMRGLFDFDALRALFASGFRLAFDAMNEARRAPRCGCTLSAMRPTPPAMGSTRNTRWPS